MKTYQPFITSNHLEPQGIESKIINKKTFKWSILADYDIGNNQSPTYSPLKIGSEIHINPITISGGFNHRFMSFGASTNINHFKITYALYSQTNKRC